MTSPILGAGSGFLHHLPPHRNPGLELVFVERGELLWQIEGTDYRVPAGSIFFTMPWEQHGSGRAFEPGHLWHYCVIDVGGAAAHRRQRLDPIPVFGMGTREGVAILKTIKSSALRCIPANARMAFLIRSAAEDFSEPSPWSAHVLACLAKWSLVELACCLSASESRGRHKVLNGRVHRFLQDLPSHLDRAWTLEEMAGACRLGRTHFANLVKTLTGDTPMAFLQRLRAERARELLLTTHRPITEIALDCGFSSSQHFARIFRHFFGQSASDCRLEQSRHAPQNVRNMHSLRRIL